MTTQVGMVKYTWWSWANPGSTWTTNKFWGKNYCQLYFMEVILKVWHNNTSCWMSKTHMLHFWEIIDSLIDLEYDYTISILSFQLLFICLTLPYQFSSCFHHRDILVLMEMHFCLTWITMSPNQVFLVCFHNQEEKDVVRSLDLLYRKIEACFFIQIYVFVRYLHSQVF